MALGSILDPLKKFPTNLFCQIAKKAVNGIVGVPKGFSTDFLPI